MEVVQNLGQNTNVVAVLAVRLQETIERILG